MLWATNCPFTALNFIFRTKANLRDLSTEAGLVNLCSLCDIGMGWMTLKNNIAPLLRNAWYLRAMYVILKSSVSWNCSYRPQAFKSDLGIWRMNSKNNRKPIPSYLKLRIFSSPSVNSNRISVDPATLKSEPNRRFFCWCDHKIWRFTLKNNRAPLLRHLFYFEAIREFKLEVQSHVTLKFACWLRKKSPIRCHFVTLCEFKLELRTGNAQIGAIFFTSVTLTFYLRPWPFVWIPPLSMVIQCENFMMIR